MGLLDGDDLQAFLGSALAGLYEDGTAEFWGFSTTRNVSTGTFPMTKSGEEACKVQRDACTEAQKREDGYTATDVRLLVLQYGLSGEITADCRVVYRGDTYRVMSVDQDPARSYWDCRARLDGARSSS